MPENKMNDKYTELANSYITQKGNSYNRWVIFTYLLFLAHLLAVTVLLASTPEDAENSQLTNLFTLGLFITYAVYWFTGFLRGLHALRSKFQSFDDYGITKDFFGKGSIFESIFGKNFLLYHSHISIQDKGFRVLAVRDYLLPIYALRDSTAREIRFGLFSLQANISILPSLKRLPHVYIDSRRNNSIELIHSGGYFVSKMLRRKQMIALGGNLDTKLRLFTHEQNAINALAVLGPDILWQLQEHLLEFDIELNDHQVTLISFKKLRKFKEADIGSLLAATTFIQDEFLPKFQKHLHQNDNPRIKPMFVAGRLKILFIYLFYVTCKLALYLLLLIMVVTLILMVFNPDSIDAWSYAA